MKIAQVLPEDRNGGAFRVPLYLHREYKKMGFKSVFFVGEKHTDWDFVFKIPNDEMRSWWARLFLKLENLLSPHLTFRGGWRVRELIRLLGQPSRQMKIWLGFEDFNFPGSRYVINFIEKEEFDILNLHVLHGFWLRDRGFFDLRLLPRITKIVPTIFTLHDMWLMTGHCSHSFDCIRWKSGCGKCPDISIPPPIRRDLSHRNWAIKKKIYENSSFWCIAPSRWMADIALSSILKVGMRGIEVIYNFVDLDIFKPLSESERRSLRGELGIPQDKVVLVSSGKSLKINRWKGFDIFFEALKDMADKDFFVLALGGAGYGDKPYVERVGKINVLYIPFESDHAKVAKYYAISDIFVLSSRAETSPLVVIEASACGVVPVAFKVGGVQELLDNEKNGFLIEPGDHLALAKTLRMLSENKELLKSIRLEAIRNSMRFDLKEQVKKYINFFFRVIDDFLRSTKKDS